MAGVSRGQVAVWLAFADHERLTVGGAVLVGPAGAAVGRRGARHRSELRVPGLVEGGGGAVTDGVAAPGDAPDGEMIITYALPVTTTAALLASSASPSVIGG